MIEAVPEGIFTKQSLQTYFCAEIATEAPQFSLATCPPGTGKTFICALLANFYTSLKRKVLIVTSNKFLEEQMLA